MWVYLMPLNGLQQQWVNMKENKKILLEKTQYGWQIAELPLDDNKVYKEVTLSYLLCE